MNFRLTIYPAMEVGNSTISFTFKTKEELESSEINMANLLLFIQDEMKAMNDYSNMFICEEFVDGEWQEIED